MTPTLRIWVRPKDTSGEELADWDLARLARDIDPDGIYVVTARFENEWTADDDRVLAAFEAAFEEAGGRGVELADRIDSLRARRDAAGETAA